VIAALVDLDAALCLLVAFAMLGQRRLATLIDLLALEGFLLAGASALVGRADGRIALEEAALLTLVLKGLVLPWLLHRTRRSLGVRWDDASPAHSVGVHLFGLAIVIAAFTLAAPLVAGGAGDDLAMAFAVVGLALLMMITRRTALAQVVGFLTLENGLFLAAVSAVRGMPMLVELGIAFDVLVVTVIFGVFFLHIHRRFDSLDLARLETLREE
jgi:hydrogenase-4 component E